jgi:hypothetical protein
MDKSKMLFAGVDAGAKMFVELNGPACCAAVGTAARQPKTTSREQNSIFEGHDRLASLKKSAMGQLLLA